MIEAITSALAIIASLTGGVMWLMKVNYRQNIHIIKTKSDLYQERYDQLKKLLSEFETKLENTTVELQRVTIELKKNTSHSETLEKEINKYVQSTEKRMSAFQSTIQRLSEDLIIVKSKPRS